MSDKLKVPNQEEFEREQDNLFRYSEKAETATSARIPLSTFYKQLNPNDPTESIAYEFLRFLYGAEDAREGLSDEVWALVDRYRPRRQRKGKGGGCSFGDARRSFSDLEAAHANLEDGQLSPERFQEAKDRHIETVARVGVPEHALRQEMQV